MLRAVLNKSWRQHPTKQQLYGYRPPITKTIKIWRTRHAEHCWRSTDELKSNILQWNPSHGRPFRTYIQKQLSTNIWLSLDNLPWAMDDRDGWRKRVREFRASSTTWWWLEEILFLFWSFRFLAMTRFSPCHSKSPYICFCLISVT